MLKVDRTAPEWSAGPVTGDIVGGVSGTSSGTVSFHLKDTLSGLASYSVTAEYKLPSAAAWSVADASVVSISGLSLSSGVLSARWSGYGKYQYRFVLSAEDNAGNSTGPGAGAGVSGITMAKVEGVISSSRAAEAETPALIVSNDSKFASKTAVRKAAQEVLRNMSGYASNVNHVIDFDTLSNGGGKLAPSSRIRVFSGSVTFGTASLTEAGTFLVSGGNAYISSNFLASKPVAIVALSDASGNGGNVFIDPSVTNVEAVLYAERAVATATDISGTAPSSPSYNQLHVKGSVLSENTIGGAKTVSCPYFVASCDLAAAERYDLNRLRDYHLDLTASGVYLPSHGGKVAGGATCSVSGSSSPCTGGLGSAYRLFADADKSAKAEAPEGTSRYAVYSTVIKYNPDVLSNPPPLFWK